MRLRIHTYIGDIYRNFYDVSHRKREVYGSGGSYAILAGKDESRSWTVSMSSLRTEDAVADCSMLKENVCDDWHTFFTCISLPHSQSIYHRKRHDIVYRVVDLPLLLRAAKWLIVRASCVVYINSGRT
jgi:hypothetical protein